MHTQGGDSVRASYGIEMMMLSWGKLVRGRTCLIAAEALVWDEVGNAGVVSALQPALHLAARHELAVDVARVLDHAAHLPLAPPHHQRCIHIPPRRSKVQMR